MKFIALKHLRRKGGGPRIEKGSVFDDSEVESLNDGDAKKAVEDVPLEPSRDELYEKAQKLNIRGRSSMTKDELASAVEDPVNIERWRKTQKEQGRSA